MQLNKLSLMNTKKMITFRLETGLQSVRYIYCKTVVKIEINLFAKVFMRKRINIFIYQNEICAFSH